MNGRICDNCSTVLALDASAYLEAITEITRTIRGPVGPEETP